MRTQSTDTRQAAGDVVAALGLLETPRSRDLLIYLHIPFCTSKCTFCHWVVDIPLRQLHADADVHRRYVDAVSEQLAFYGPILRESGYTPKYVYWGGGTPTALSPDLIVSLGRALRAGFDLSAVEEYSVEASPETLDEATVEALIDIGTTRLSIGVQSFDDEELMRTNRAHTAQQARDAVALAAGVGLHNINVDIIVGMPGQERSTLETTLRETVSLDLPHVTAYPFMPVPGSAMAIAVQRGQQRWLGSDERADALRTAASHLRQAGYSDYLPFYFARSVGSQFRAEEYYFRLLGDYFGFGCGANSLINGHYLRNEKTELHHYLRDPTGFDVCARFADTREGLFHVFRRETFQLGLPIRQADFEARFGMSWNAVRKSDVAQMWISSMESRGASVVDTGNEIRTEWAAADERGDTV